ncbi:hypothetical protein B0H14DRAFT_2929654 [Mycena olivaceomarginata]|nr:hypothetical protein B0H14DRAFT_2929654 [Mycena olivaceomarginata]
MHCLFRSSALSGAICAPAGLLLWVTPAHCALPPSQRCAWPPIRFAHSTMTSSNPNLVPPQLYRVCAACRT